MFRIIICALLASFVSMGSMAQAQGGDLPVDPNVRIGTLDNGLTYYLRNNQKPKNRVELRLVIDAGSLQEDDDQQGLAHFLEHMAFNGTENFAANDLVDYLESIGARFGPDLNAYTSFDETVYMLEIPTDEEGLVDKGFSILRDWASRITIDEAEVEKERGVVLEEWRLGLGASERLRQVHWPVLFQDSRYAKRLPIGKPEVIEQAPRQRLEDFYRDWYRPNLMAVIAVGDIDVDGAEKLIRDTFGDLENPANPRPREAYGVPAHKDMLASVATDPEQSFTQTWVAFKHPPAEDRGSREAYRNALLNGLFSGMLTARLSELSKETDPPFLFGVASPGGFVRGTDMFSVAAGTKEEGVERGLKTLMTEIARVRAHGFTQTELERAKADYMAGIERAFNERDKTDNGAYAAEYIRNFLEDEPIPGIEAEYEFAKQVIPAIPLDEVNRAIDVLVHEDNTVIVVSGPEKEGVVLPTKEALLAVAAEGTATTPEAYDDAISQSSLM
ncbi:MAG: insulinase family protein, partial [Candidatus Eisenbacteria bacterium]|nr:insulinase family protein [Candidatus Eisenbacteria bacterium]